MEPVVRQISPGGAERPGPVSLGVPGSGDRGEGQGDRTLGEGAAHCAREQDGGQGPYLWYLHHARPSLPFAFRGSGG